MFVELVDFLKDKRRIDNGPMTHAIHHGDQRLRGSYNVNISDIPKLYDLISDIKDKGGKLSILERVGDICPLIIDLDFKYENDIDHRQYTPTTLEQLSIYIFKKIKELYRINDENQSHIWIMEKEHILPCDKPTYKKKDGIHILFPNIISDKKTYIKLIESIIKDTENVNKLFQDTCIGISSNPINEIFDTHIYNPGNWYVYGTGKPNEIVYELTNIFKINDNSVSKLPIDTFIENPREIMNKNSVQLHKNINIEYIGPEILKKKPIINNVNLNNNNSIDLDNIEDMENYVKIKKDELDYAKKLSGILSKERATDCKTWIDVGYCLHSISSKHLLQAWIVFSKKWKGFCNEDECKKQWEYMNNTSNKQYTMGTLIFWAKQDNYDEFIKIHKESLKEIIEKTIKGEKNCGAHTDVANVVYNYYKNLFVCSGLKDSTWFYFNEQTGRWKETEHGHELRKRLSYDIISIFEHYSKFYKDKRGDDPESETYEINDRKHSNCLKNILKLKDSGYKDKIMKECKERFYDGEFMDKLNGKKNLIGFDNGVVDLKSEYLNYEGNLIIERIFRQGRPDDYVSLSVGYSLPVCKEDLPININEITENIVHINGYKELNDDLEDFILKVLPKDDVRDYTLRFLSSCLSGEIREEKFYFWTGSGSNGKSKITDLINYTLGDYSKTMDVAYLTTKRGSSAGASPELEAIRYARFVSMSEPEKDDQIYVGKLKQITGGDTMTSRGLFKNTTEFKPQFKLMLMCNDLPKLAGNDGGVARRIEVVDFISKFTNNPRPSTHNPHQYMADLQLGEKLKQWNILFMIKLLDYYTLYDKEGTKSPESVTAATSVYITESDTVQKWISEDLSESDNVTSLDDLMDNLKTWCDDVGYDYKKIVKKDVFSALSKAQEKTEYGPPVFGRLKSDKAPNGTTRCPKFNFRQVDDEDNN
uniref:SF3 helicase domain-containing protein n=1 Tax=viral metagenome TaxID=1070528 RepID=A0A6C0C4U0_9ZZZZ